MPEGKKRSRILAGLLTLLAGEGVGFLYLGKWRWAIGLAIGLPLILAISAWTKVLHTPLGLAVTCMLLIGGRLGAVILAMHVARQSEIAPLRKYQRWYFYVGFFVLNAILGDAVFGNRGRILGYEAFRAPAGSMMDTLLPGDYFFCNTWEYRNRIPKRGEVIVFVFPKDPSLKYVQRVIGLPGDTVRTQGASVWVNGTSLDEPYVKRDGPKGSAMRSEEYKLSAQEFFVLGDNRYNSSDSRIWGTLPAANIYGRVEYIFLSYGGMSFEPKRLRFERIGRWVQ